MLKTLIATASVAAGLLMLDVARPVLTGDIAEAAQRKVAAVRRPPPRPAVRAKPRVNFARPKSNFVKPKAAFKFKATPKAVHTQHHQFKKSTFQQKQITPQIKKGFKPVNAFKKTGPGPGPG